MVTKDNVTIGIEWRFGPEWQGSGAVNGWHQIFFYDPDGNVIEVHQVDQN